MITRRLRDKYASGEPITIENFVIKDTISTSTGLKWGKIGSSQLLNESGDLSFLFYFSKQCLVGNIQGIENVKKIHR